MGAAGKGAIGREAAPWRGKPERQRISGLADVVRPPCRVRGLLAKAPLASGRSANGALVELDDAVHLHGGAARQRGDLDRGA